MKIIVFVVEIFRIIAMPDKSFLETDPFRRVRNSNELSLG